MACLWCKTAELKDNVCPNCGKFFYSDQEMEAIVGASNLPRIRILFSLTDRYIIIHKAKHFEQSNNGLGLIGGAVVAAAVTMAKEGKMAYGFYGLHELREVIYPYHNKKFKKAVAMKLIFKDGTDMILTRWDDKLMQKISEFMAASGVRIINGVNMNHGDVFCTRPIVDDDNIGLRVCADIAPHIKMMKGNFAAPPMAGAAASVQPQYQAPAQPAAPVQPAYQPPQPAYTAPAASAKPTTVAELNLRVATYNALLRMGLDRVEELVACTREALTAIGFDAKMIDEIEEALHANGMELAKMRPPVAQPAAPVAPAPAPKPVEPAPAPKPAEPAPKPAEPTPAPAPQSEAQQSVERFDQVFDAGLSRVMEIASSTREELLAKGMSPEDVDEIEDVLEDHGLSLAEPEIPARPEKIEELELGIMPFAHLFKLEITTVDQLVALSREQLLGKGVDEWNIDQIEARLGAFGLCLAQPAPIAEPVPAAEPAPVAEPVQIPEPAPAPVVEHKREEAPAIPKRDPNVKFCRNCGAKLRRSDNFCVECGADQR